MQHEHSLWLKEKLIEEGYVVYITGARGSYFLQIELHQDDKLETTCLQMPKTLSQAALRYWMASTYIRHGRISMLPKR